VNDRILLIEGDASTNMLFAHVNNCNTQAIQTVALDNQWFGNIVIRTADRKDTHHCEPKTLPSTLAQHERLYVLVKYQIVTMELDVMKGMIDEMRTYADSVGDDTKEIVEDIDKWISLAEQTAMSHMTATTSVPVIQLLQVDYMNPNLVMEAIWDGRLQGSSINTLKDEDEDREKGSFDELFEDVLIDDSTAQVKNFVSSSDWAQLFNQTPLRMRRGSNYSKRKSEFSSDRTFESDFSSILQDLGLSRGGARKVYLRVPPHDQEIEKGTPARSSRLRKDVPQTVYPPIYSSRNA
jgi:hypothetical protein